MLTKSLVKAFVGQAASDVPGADYWIIIASHLIDSIDTQEQALDRVERLMKAQVTNPLRTGKVYLEDAKHASSLEDQRELVKKAQDEFRKISTYTDEDLPDTPLLPIESMIYVGICFELRDDHRNALRWYEKAHKAIIAYEDKLLETDKKKDKKKLENIYPKIIDAVYTSAELLHATNPDLETATLIIEGQELIGHSGGVKHIIFFADNLRLATGADDYQIKIWDVKTGTEIKSLAEHSQSVNDLAVSPDGSLLASASHDKTVKVWNVEQDSSIFTFTGHGNDWVNCVDFSVDGNLLASGANDRTVIIWEALSGKIVHTFTGHTDWVKSVQFSSSGSLLASGSDDKTVKLWHLETGAELKTLSGHNDWIRQVTFSSDGTLLATASNDKTVKVWDVESGKEVIELIGHTDRVTSVAFSPDNSLLVSGSDDDTMKLWNVSTGTEVRLYFIGNKHTSDVRTVAYSSDGRLVASGSRDKTIRLWNVLSRVQYQQGSMKRLT